MSVPTNRSAHNALQTTNLSPDQRRAVNFRDGVLLVDAGPGAGKTRAIAMRVGQLVKDHRVAPSAIVCVSFTNPAKTELRDRIKLLAGTQVIVETYHSLAHRMLNESDRVRPFRVLAEGPQWEAFVGAAQICGERNHAVIRRVRNAVTFAKNHGQTTAAEYEPPRNTAPQFAARVSDIWLEYELWCQRGGELTHPNHRGSNTRWLDFDDLLVEGSELLRCNHSVRQALHNEWRHVMVDEFQDSNVMQYQLVRMILENRPSWGPGEKCPVNAWSNRSLMVVGDPDQAIYHFRGGDPHLILGYTRDYPGATVITLADNYRSTGNIVGAATAVIVNNRQRTPKHLRSTKGRGIEVRLTGLVDAKEEAQLLASRAAALWQQHAGGASIAVLTRHNALQFPLQQALREAGVISVRDAGVSLSRAPEIGYMVDLITLARNPHDDPAVSGVLAGVAHAALKQAMRDAKVARISLWEALAHSADPEIQRLRRTVGHIHDALKRGRNARAFALAFDHTRWAEKLLAEDKPEFQDRLRALTLAISGFASHEESGDSSNLDDLYSAFSEASHPVRLLTAHSAKALEWDYVFIAGADEERWPLTDNEGYEEERRLFYVAMTRARKGLFISFLKERPLEFVNEIPDDFVIYEESQTVE